MGDSVTIPDICLNCGKRLQITPHRPGDRPNPPVHVETGKVECEGKAS